MRVGCHMDDDLAVGQLVGCRLRVNHRRTYKCRLPVEWRRAVCQS